GESGAYLGGRSSPLPLAPLAASEEKGTKFATTVGADSLAALRAKPADKLLEAAMASRPWLSPSLDGYVLTEDPYATFAAATKAEVPRLGGWTADEIGGGVGLGKERPTAQTFTADTRKRFGDEADAVLKAYPAGTDAEALESAASLGSDMFIGYGTWKWLAMHAKTG